MFADKKILTFFPTYGWVHDLRPEDYGPLNAQIAAKVEALISPRPQLPPGEIWQTDQVLHELPEFAEFCRYAEAAVSGALDFLNVRHEGFVITGCWANISPPGAGHFGHTHPNNYLSGVYYVRTPPGANSITFHDPRIQTNIIAPHFHKTDQHNALSATVPVQEGRMILFPSWLLHSVHPSQSSEERMSISFNIMFDDFAQSMAHPRWRSMFGSKKMDAK